jgi:hypothetical protein
MVLYAVFKAAISGILVSAVSETAKKSPSLGGLIASLPIVSVLAMIWLWQDTRDAERIAAHSESTFWLVLPSLPMFLVLPTLLRSGIHFYAALAISCILTVILYAAMIWVLRRFGMHF